MEKLMKKFFRSSLIASLFLIALGLLLIFQSDAVIYSISYIIGGILIAIGVLAIIKFIQNKTLSLHASYSATLYPHRLNLSHSTA